MDAMTFWTAVTALGTLTAGFFAWRAAVASGRAAEGQFLSQLLAEYRSEEMLDALRQLKGWHNAHGDEFAAKWLASLKAHDGLAQTVDLARRAVNSFFFQVYTLHRAKALSSNTLAVVVELPGALLYLDTVQKLEEQLNPHYDRRPYSLIAANRTALLPGR